MRTNNFDLIRFVLASVVVFFHAAVLSQSESLAILSRHLSSELAVKGFFIVSGFLILRSWEGSRGIADYASKRVRRIYPAYAAVVLGAALLGAIATTLPPSRYFSVPWLRYVGANMAFLNFLAPDLPGLFTGNAITAVNGALWTIKIEVMFYALAPALAWLMRRYGAVRAGAAVYALSVIYNHAMLGLADATGRDLFRILSYQLPGQLSYFAVGAVLHYREQEVRRWLLPGAAIGVVLMVAGGPLVDKVLHPLLLGFVVIYCAVGLPCLGNFGRFGDFSYGIYVIHFPVLQWMVWRGWFRESPVVSLAIAWGVILTAAFLSWHLVERPFLLRSSHYVRAAERRRPGG